jgi:glycosyltransferase involved in cell wall biosynthesis
MMNILYIAYENVFSTGILQAQVINQMETLHRKNSVSYSLISTTKISERSDPLYLINKENTIREASDFIDFHEFKKTIENKQSVFSFVKDITTMLIKIYPITRKSDVIHARSYGAGTIALILSAISSKPFIFDMRGILPEETVQVGKIKYNSFKYKLLKFIEKLLVKKADMVFTVSENFTNYIISEFQVKPEKLFNISNPTIYSSFHHISKPDKVVNFVYSGSCQDWHCPEETLSLFKQVHDKFQDKVFLKICSSDKVKFDEMAIKIGLCKSSYSVDRIPFKDMGDVYKNSHIGFCFRKPGLTTKVSCPVKFAEYLASGLIVISNYGVSDFDKVFAQNPQIGTLLDLENYDINDIILLVTSVLDKEGAFQVCRLEKFDWNNVSQDVYNIYYGLKKING